MDKKDNADFDVAMGAKDSAQIADLIGLYILYNLTNNTGLVTESIGLYRDDGLLVLRNCNGQQVDKIGKTLTKKFKEMDFRVDITPNIKIANFLDVSFNLMNNSFENYIKPNTRVTYINCKSNHPKAVFKALPKSINARLSQNSSNESLFNKHKDKYEIALRQSGRRN